MNTLLFYLIIAIILFGIGILGIIASRQKLKIILCAYLIIFSAIINFMAFSKYHGHWPQMKIFASITFLITILQLLILLVCTYKEKMKTNSRLD